MQVGVLVPAAGVLQLQEMMTMMPGVNMGMQPYHPDAKVKAKAKYIPRLRREPPGRILFPKWCRTSRFPVLEVATEMVTTLRNGDHSRIGF
jgi:hypothetical protein